MILYHGSNVEIEKIDLDLCRPYKDFGRGFYLTTIESQAGKMALRTSKIYGGKPVFSGSFLPEIFHSKKWLRKWNIKN
ncbi:MAG: DUF3990 domain-containing protein [Lachnospiraceae bacterium]|nr:DUF3990 domain-containing protein [Lachnospiraceae bacterium]